MKIIVIGGNAAGLSAASAIRKAHSDWELAVYEKGSYVSYGGCGIPYYIEGIVPSINNLITLTPQTLVKGRNIPIFLHHQVESVDFAQKIVQIKNLETNTSFKSNYDKIIIATGASPRVIPNLSIVHDRVLSVHTLEEAEHLRKIITTQPIKSAVIIGMGYIGLEMLEAYKAHHIDQLTVIGDLSIFDSKSLDFVLAELKKQKINVIFPALVQQIIPKSPDQVIVKLKDREILTDFVQVSIGVVPNTEIFKGTAIKMLPNGAIITDEYMRTNIPDVYAAGDCATAYHQLLKQQVYMPLAPAANKQGRIAGEHAAGEKGRPFSGIVGTIICKVLDIYCGKTGLSENQAKSKGYDVGSTLIENLEHAGYYPGAAKMSIVLVYDKTTHLLLGAEITAPTPLGAKKIDVLATAIQQQMKIEQIQDLDLSYAPPFAPVWDPILIAANIAAKDLK